MKPIHVRLGTPVAPALTFLYVARSPAKFLRNWHSVLRLEGKREPAHARTRSYRARQTMHARSFTLLLSDAEGRACASSSDPNVIDSLN